MTAMSNVSERRWYQAAALILLSSCSAAASAEDASIRVLLAPAQETVLSSPIAARITTLNASLGSTFKAGDNLVVLECGEQKARLDMARAELATAREQHQAQLRLKELRQASDVEVALAAHAVTRGQAQVQLNQVQLAQCNITAPFNGRVVQLNAKPYQSVKPAEPLLEIISAGTLKLRLNAPAQWVSWLAEGTPFDVSIDETGKRYPASVSALNARIDPISQTIELEATLNDNTGELLPGMSGTAHFTPPDSEL